MDLSRRRLLALAGGAGAAGLVAGCAPASRSLVIDRPVRYEVNSARGRAALDTYRVAVAALKRLPDTDPRSWTRQAQLHASRCRHASWLFFPWHRAYVHFFEQICRAVTGQPGFALPYWDWSAHPSMPAAFFEPASPLYHDQRALTPTSAAGAEFVGPTVVAAILAEPNFLVFGGAATDHGDPNQYGPGYGLVEQSLHNYIHGFVGGTMATLASPLDPIFWLHHNRIDQLWARWSLDPGHPDPGSADWAGTRFAEFCDAQGQPVSISVGQSAALARLSYRFDDPAMP